MIGGDMEVSEPEAVWAVVFSNYDPREIDSLWWNEEEASARAEELGEMWRVEKMAVEGRKP